jgi:hypothetical protein
MEVGCGSKMMCQDAITKPSSAECSGRQAVAANGTWGMGRGGSLMRGRHLTASPGRGMSARPTLDRSAVALQSTASNKTHLRLED